MKRWTLVRIFRPKQFERVRGGSFAHCFRLDSENPRDEHRNEAVGWRLSHCWWVLPPVGEIAPGRREESSIDPLGFALQGSFEGMSTPSKRSIISSSVERVRAARSGRTLFLLLVSLRRCPDEGCDSAEPATNLLQGLGLCVREVDFVGWYRDGRVAGAVLAQGFDEPCADASCRIVERVTRVLSERVPRSVVGRLRVRVVKLGSQSK